MIVLDSLNSQLISKLEVFRVLFGQALPILLIIIDAIAIMNTFKLTDGEI